MNYELWFRRMKRRHLTLMALESITGMALLLASAKLYDEGRHLTGYLALVLAFVLALSASRTSRILRRRR